MEKFIYSENEYGKYAIPKSSSHRPASQITIKGGIWEKQTLEYILNLNLNNDIIHAGTYFGDFLPFLSKIFNKVWAFEISKNNYEAAEETLKINNINNVTLYQNAIGENEDTVFIETNVNNNDLGGVSKVRNYETTENISQISLDSIITEDSVIDLIQLDIEGYEINALKGAMKIITKFKPILILEDNNNDTEKEWFIKNIINLGYKKIHKVNDNKVFKYDR